MCVSLRVCEEGECVILVCVSVRACVYACVRMCECT